MKALDLMKDWLQEKLKKRPRKGDSRWILFLCLFLFPGWGWGEDGGGGASVRVMTVDELVAHVLSTNPDLAQAVADVEMARGERRAAGQWKNPEVEVEYGEKRVFDRSTGELNGKGNSQGYRLSQTFEFPGKASLRKAIASRQIQLADLALQQLRLEVAARTRLLAMEQMVAHQESFAAREVADRSETLVEILRKRSPAGVQGILDQRIMEANLVNILTHSREVEERRERARVSLNLLGGRTPGDDLQLQMPLKPAEFQKGWEELWEKAKVSNKVLQASVVRLEKAEKSLAQSQLASAPDITISPFYSEERAGDRERVAGVGISLPLPFWDSNRGETDAARAGVTAAHAGRIQALQETEKELFIETAALGLVLKQLEKTPPSLLGRLRQGADLADRQYRLGAISVQTYIEMQAQYLEASSNLLNTIRDTHEHALRIQVLTGDVSLLEGGTR